MKTILTSALLLISMGFIACKKENTTLPNSNIQKIIGKWDMISDVTNDYYGGSSHITTYNFQPGDFSEFKIGGKYSNYNSGSTYTSDYGFINESKIWIGFPNNLYDIKVLTEKNLQLYKKTVAGSDYYESTFYLEK